MNAPSERSQLNFTGKVSPEWLDRGEWLAEAAIALADSNTFLAQQMMAEGTKQFALLRDGENVASFRISSQLLEEERDADAAAKLRGNELAAWRKYRGGLAMLQLDLMHRLTCGMLLAFGDPDRPGADREWIPVRSWFHLKLDEGCRNKVSGAGNSYWYVKVIDLNKEKLLNAMPLQPPAHRLKSATSEEIDAAISSTFSAASAGGGKPPNGKELHAPVKAFLKEQGLSATQPAIDARSGQPDFKKLRNPPGKPPNRVKS